MKFNKYIETLVIFGTYGRRDIASASLQSLLKALPSDKAQVIVSDGSPRHDYKDDFIKIDDIEYIWTPDQVSMATSRNIALRLAQDKYVFDWILFLEDDLLYSEHWYDELLDFAKANYGKISPLGLAYGVFCASPCVPSRDDTSEYDDKNDCHAELFGPRADQRLYKASHYFNISKEWESDLLGISSCQTGKVNHRSTMRGFCSAYIGHRNLCSLVENEESTWIGLRDIGPAAFDKRFEGYSAIIDEVKKHSSVDHGKDKPTSGNKEKADTASPPKNSIPGQTMTSIVPDRTITSRTILRRFKKAIKLIKTGNY